ncbi:hypothetical protein [Marilutibacter spongiae]|uniref:Uncharacterized protein n=1 Tax=Marilutibacter spongiae TaxID=2025720 RepID=A0A7W3TLY5_9GAMM|nr:hypothetical protein [Lysobacter spongiae]MBB1060439.1 hypothetical protein [Lysobacter spongiae]
MLPDGFKWTKRSQYDEEGTAVVLGDAQVAMLLERVDGGWVARLNSHWPVDAPLVTRRCQSKATGTAGIEAWVCRHEARLRAEAGALAKVAPHGRKLAP